MNYNNINWYVVNDNRIEIPNYEVQYGMYYDDDNEDYEIDEIDEFPYIYMNTNVIKLVRRYGNNKVRF
jgi:hypothetical protein